MSAKHVRGAAKVNVKNAVEMLRAVQLSPRKWAYYAEETSAWYVVSRRDLADLGELLAAGETDAYSHWCAACGREATPAEVRAIGGAA